MTGSEVCFCGGKSTRVKTPAVQTVRELVYQRLSIVAEELNQRLAAVAAEIAGLFEEQLCSPPQHGDQQHKLLDTVPKTGDHRADLHHHLVTEEEVFFQQQEWNPVVDQKEPEATQTEEKLGDFWTIHNGEELQQLEEVDVTKFPIILNVKSENDEENPQLLVSKELNSPESGDWSTNVSHEEPEPPQNKQEQEECWTSQEEEQLQQLEEVDAIKFPMKDTCLEDSQLHDSTSVSEDVPDASSKNKEKVLGSDAEELSEEESLPPTVGDEISPTHKRRKPSSPVDEMPSLKTTSKAKGRQPSEGDGIPPKKMKRKLSPVGGGAVRHSKDKVLRKRKFWQQAEVQAVERQMDPFIRSCVVPAKRDCEKCLRAEPEALKNRNWQTLKFYVHNRIQAYKKKVQR
ncbi:uncharacterized protein LOC117502534 isoform X6 [Thalassophryne amazonica]|uniref:uncharacterized protein LOC117502534 isoform X6 n=1 Tax=Thalassophryne amazonica TaxID=390379 RepID=UPI001471B780|nr:uncharacterized protein LOC117502534 isoform X6 [Thalassophryne amazonica]